MVQNGLSRPFVYKTPIYRRRIHRTMEKYEVDERGYPTAKGCYELIEALIGKMGMPLVDSREYTHYRNALYALGYIKSALKVSE